MNVLLIALTVVIAAATCVQALVAFRLWQLQKSIEDERTRTSIGVAVEIRRPDPNRPAQAYLRVENASSIGVMVTETTLRAKVKTRTSKSLEKDLNYVIGPYGSRDVEVSQLIRDAAVDANPNDPDWQSVQHSADVSVTVNYRVGTNLYIGSGATYRVNFQAAHFIGAERL